MPCQSSFYMDILSHTSLLVDIAKRRLLVTNSFHATPFGSTVATQSLFSQRSRSMPTPHLRLCCRLQPIASTTPECTNQTRRISPHNNYWNTYCIYSRVRRIGPQKLTAAKVSFSEMESIGSCSKHSSHWASSLHMVSN